MPAFFGGDTQLQISRWILIRMITYQELQTTKKWKVRIKYYGYWGGYLTGHLVTSAHLFAREFHNQKNANTNMKPTNHDIMDACLFHQLQTHTNPLVKFIGPFNHLFDSWKSLGKHTRSHHFSSVVLSFLQPPCLQYLPPGHVKAHFLVSFTFPAAVPAQSLAPL